MNQPDIQLSSAEQADMKHRYFMDQANRAKSGSLVYPALVLILFSLTDVLTELNGVAYLLGGIIVLTSLIRVAMFRWNETLIRHSHRLWMWYYAGNTCMIGFSWGLLLASALAFNPEAFSTLIIIMIVLGTTAGAVNSLAMNYKVNLSYTILMIYPGIVSGLIRHSHAHLVIALLLFLFSVFIIVISLQIYHQYWRSLTQYFMLKAGNRELNKSRELALAASEAKSQFLANVSHEIRTPLNGVIGMTTIMLDTTLTPGQRDKLNTIQQSAHSLLSIINDILDFSKIEAGMLEIQQEDFNVRQRLNRVVRLLESVAMQKGVRMRLDMDEQIPSWLQGDASRIEQVLINLTGNAVKFTKAGSVVIRCKQISENDGYYQVCIAVEDTGIGIPEEKQQHIFEAFSQADGSTTRKYGGTGLGLTISRQLAELMGGTLTLQSPIHDHPERPGSAFKLTLPLKKAADPHAETAPDREGDASSRVIPTLKILVAEDNKVNQTVIRAMLKKLNHEVHLVENGQEALDFLEEHTVDLVLMDMQMPVMDGMEASARILSDPRFADIKVIALTAHAMKGDRERILEAGLHDYLSKPVNYDVLQEALARQFT